MPASPPTAGIRSLVGPAGCLILRRKAAPAAEKADEPEKPCCCGQAGDAEKAPAEKCACGCASEEKTDEENK